MVSGRAFWTSSRHIAWLLTTTAVIAVGTIPATAQQAPEADRVSAAASATYRFNIPAKSLAAAIADVGAVSGWRIAYPFSLPANVRSKPLSGSMTPPQAVGQLLAGTGLSYRISGAQSIVLVDPKQQAASGGALPAGAIPLETIDVQGNSKKDPGRTEGTGSYTTRSMSTATPLNLSVRETPQSVSIITHDRMQDQRLTKVDEVLEQVVGIEPDRRGAVASDTVAYYSRGFEIKNFQVDGVTRPGGIYGFFEDTVDTVAYDRIEVVRGPSGLMTGTGTPSATINLVRKKASDTFKGSVAASGGSWGLYRTEVDLTGPLTEGGKVRGRFAAAQQGNDTFVDREHADRTAVYGIIEADVSEQTRVSAGIEYQKYLNSGASRGGVPLFYTDGSETRLSRSTNSGADWSKFGRDSLSTFVTLNHSFNDDWTVDVSAEHKEGSYDQKFGYAYGEAIDKNTGAGASIYNTRFAGDVKLDTINARLKGEFELFGRRHQLALNAFHGSYSSRSPDYPIWYSGSPYRDVIGNVYDFYRTGYWPQPDLTSTGKTNGNDAKTTAFSGVLRLKPLERVSVILGSRITNWEHNSWSEILGGSRTTSPVTKENGVITPYGGVVVDITDNWSLYGSYTSVFDPQNVKDITGSVLKPLEGNNYEVGAKGEFFNGRLNVTAAAFWMRQNNFPIQDGFQVLAPDGSRAYHPDSVKATGYELEIAGELLPNWQVVGGFSHVKLKGTEAAPLSLTRIPENTFKLFTSYRFATGPLSGFTVGGGVRWQSSVYLDNIGPNGERFVQDPIFVVDAMIQYKVQDNFTVSLNLKNIFDKTYYDSLDSGASRYGVPRSFILTGRYTF